MEAAIAISYRLVEKSLHPLRSGSIDHDAERCGKLVSNYRSLGVAAAPECGSTDLDSMGAMWTFSTGSPRAPSG
jgi:hypothetical protein